MTDETGVETGISSAEEEAGIPPLRVGVIGCGNMGSAIISALDAGAKRGELSLFAWNRTRRKAEELLARGRAVTVCDSPKETAQASDIVFLCVKPPQVSRMTAEAADGFAAAGKADGLAVSIAAATTLAAMRSAAGEKCHVARIMPTTTLAVGEGVFALVTDESIPAPLLDQLKCLLARMGAVYEMPERDLTAFGAAIGCAPGFIFHLLQGLVDGAVALGFSRAQAHEMVVRTTLGCALLARESGLSLHALKDQVASPGGMTIQGLAVLERNGVAGHIMDALAAACKKGNEMENR